MNNIYSKLLEGGIDYTDRFGFKYYVQDYIKANNRGLQMKGILVSNNSVLVGYLTENGMIKNIF